MQTLLNSVASKLSARRVRTHAWLLGACLWTLYMLDLATPGLLDRAALLKGTDFIHFYTLGSLALRRDGLDLYNMRAQSALIAQLVPAARGLAYLPLYGPQVSLLFAPLAKLPYGLALVDWWVLSASLYAACCYAIWSRCEQLRPYGSTVFIAAAAYPPFFHLIEWGQTSAPALLSFTLAFFAFRKERHFLAGLAIGLLAFKPALALAAALLFVLTWNWRVMAGAMITSFAQIAVGWAYYGNSVMHDYLNALWHVPSVFGWLEPRPYQVHCLLGFWTLLIPLPKVALVFYLGTAAACVGLTVWIWRTGHSLSLRYAALLLATTLVAPHLTVYDLVVLAPGFLWLSDWALAHQQDPSSPAVRVLLYLGYALPLIGPLAKWTHVQLSVIAFALLLAIVGRMIKARKDVALLCSAR